MHNYLQGAPFAEIRKYRSDNDFTTSAIPYSGTPRKHPYDSEKLLLIERSSDGATAYLEFRIADVLHVEDLPNLVSETGENLTMAKIWIRRGSFGLRFVPFEVGSTGQKSPE